MCFLEISHLFQTSQAPVSKADFKMLLGAFKKRRFAQLPRFSRQGSSILNRFIGCYKRCTADPHDGRGPRAIKLVGK